MWPAAAVCWLQYRRQWRGGGLGAAAWNIRVPKHSLMARLGRLKKLVVGPKGDRELIYVRVQLNNVFITENWFVVSTWIQLSDVFIT